MATQKCDCASCSCNVSTDTAVEKDGQYYCSEACANNHPNGEKCGHAGCDC